jgi:hypothetical protein
MKLEQVRDMGDPSNGQQPMGLLDFAHKLTQQMKGYKVSVSKMHNMLYVYREGDNYVMGIIGYGDFQTSGDGNDRFAVWSPNIQNNEIQPRATTEHVSSSERDKAVKNAMKYIRPLTVEQTMKLSIRQCASAAREVVSKIRDNAGEIRRELVNNFFDTSTYSAPKPNALQRELRHLVESGYEFLDKDLGDKLHKMFDGLKELEAARQVVDNTFTFVEAFVSPTGRQMFRVHTDVDTTQHYAFIMLPDNTSVYDQHNLPDELAGKLSVLSMLEPEGYVEGVGYRAADNVFYVRG